MAIDTLAVVGLGYVGLPLAVAFGKQLPTIGFDISDTKIARYKEGVDPMNEVTSDDFAQAVHLTFSHRPADLQQADMIIVAVPTPISTSKMPDLGHMTSASKIVGRHLKRGAIVVYESTVYPGVTEDICAPLLERESGMKSGRDFFLGYSPERINPGDPEHSLATIVKVVSAQDEATLETVAEIYGKVVKAGIYKAESIRVAEAAKVIENTQRDLNIALMNELAVIFNRLGIDTQAVLRAANTKWNFLPFKPGLVGGHCIGVDPYYLTYCAQMAGYHPDVILAGRRINDAMGHYVAQRTVKELILAKVPVEGARVGILGLTFKENCPDLRNTRVIDIVRELQDYKIEPMIHDPMASPVDAVRAYDIALLEDYPKDLDGVILAVAHDHYKSMGPAAIRGMLRPSGGVVIDIKCLFCPHDFNEPGLRYWRL